VTSLDRFLEQLGDEGGATPVDQWFEQFGMRQNPFPPNRTIIPDLMYNQEFALQQFSTVVRDVVLSTEPRRRALGVLAGTGGGKTHFLHHCRWLVEQIAERRQKRFVFVNFTAGEGRARDIVAEAFRAADDMSGGDFLGTLIVRLNERKDRDEILDSVEQDDLREALKLLVRASAKDFAPLGREGQYDFVRLKDTCVRWLHGGSLSATEQKYLGTFGRITTASMATRVFREAFTLARTLNVFNGVMLSLDEVETLFTGALRSTQFQGFLQDVRYMYDETVRVNRGFGFIVLAASTAQGARLLGELNYPVYQRLNFEEGNRVQLAPIGGPEEAIAFANVYTQYEHDKWLYTRGGNPSATTTPLLTDDEIVAAFRRATSGNAPDRQPGRRANQAPMLDALHKAVEAKRRLRGGSVGG
jgi:hypothetical protein